MSVNVGTAIAYLDLDLTAFNSGLQSAQSALQTFTDSSSSFSDKLTAVGSVATNVGSGLTKTLTLPITEFAKTAIDAGMSFDTAMSKVEAISGATGDEVTALRDKAIEMGAKTKFSATESAEAFTYMAMAGWKTGDMLEGIEGIMNLAAASGEDLATTSDIVTDALTAFGMEAGEAGDFANILAVAASSANTDVYKMGETFKYVAPIAGAMGYSANDSAIAIGLMANSGLKASQAGTALRSIITRLSTDAGASSKSLGALGTLTEELGVQFYDSEGNARALNEVLMESRDAWQGLTDEQQINYAKTIAGQEAMSGWLAIMNASEQDINKLTSALEDCDTAAEDMANTMLDNLEGSITLLSSALETLYNRVYALVEPMIRDMIDNIRGVVEWLATLDDTQLQVIIQIAAVVAAIGPVLMIVGKLITSISTITGTLSQLAGVFGGFNLAMVAVVAGIAMLVAGFVQAYQNSEEVRQAVSQLVNAVGQLGAGVVEIMGAIWKAVEPVVTVIIQLISELVESLFPPLVNLISSILSALEPLIPVISAILEFIGNLVSALIEFLIPAFKAVAEVIGVVIDALSFVVDGISGFVKSLFGIKDDAKEAATGIGTGFVQGIDDSKGKAETSISSLADGVLSTFGNKLGSDGTTSTVFESFGKSSDQGYANGLISGETGVVGAVNSVGDSVTSTFQTHTDALGDIASNGASDIENTVYASNAEILKAYQSGAIDQEEAQRLHLEVQVQAMKSHQTQISNDTHNFISDIINSIGNFFYDMISSVGNFFKNVTSDINSWINSIFTFLDSSAGKMFSSGEKLFTSFWNGLKSVWNGIWSWVQDVWEKVTAKLSSIKDALFEGRMSEMFSGSHANGLDYVPYNGYVAQLHEGERVLTRNEADEYRSNGGEKSSGGDTFNFYNTKPDPYEYARQMKRAKKELAYG